MMTAEPDYRWDGDRWWRWSKGRWSTVSAADPQPRLVDVGPVPDHADSQVVSSWMRFRGSTKRALRLLPEVLAVDESTEFVLAADHQGTAGILVLTSDRLLFLSNSRNPGIDFEAAAPEVRSATVVAGRLRHPITVRTARTVGEFRCVDAAAATALVGLLTLRSGGHVLTTVAPGGDVLHRPVRRNREAETPPPGEVETDTPNHSSEPDAVAALQNLTRMFELGLVSQAEFDAKRAEIIDRL
jgi:hypothetical protein